MSRVTRKLLGKRNKGDKDGTSSTVADLDEEMEKVFAMSENDKFDFARFLTEDSELKAQRRYNEKEFSSSYRKKSYPHIHLPIKGFKAHSRRAGFSRNKYRTENEKTDTTEENRENNDVQEEPEATRTELKFYDGTFEEPVVSERAAVAIGNLDTSPERHVKFFVGPQDTSNSLLNENEEKATEHHKNAVDHKLKRKHGYHHKKLRKHMGASDISKGHKASFVSDGTEEGEYQVILKLEEPLQEFVQDDVTSHRFDCSRDKRRFSTKSALSSILNKRGPESSIVSALPIKIYKKNYDHSPHEVFVQLDELSGVGEDQEWKETARWIKYEEDVEEGADRWGRPHVASLSFHSLLNLRRCLETG